MFTSLRFTKIILAISLAVFFAPLFGLMFFNHASADDYICGYHLQNEGFWHYQSYIYNGWGGRFAATFAGSSFAVNNFLYRYYYLPALLLLLLNVASVLFLFFIINRHILKDENLQKISVFVCLLFTSLQFCSLAEPATYLFWFSSAVTYQLPIILLQFQISLWVLLFHSGSKLVSVISSCFIVLLTILINGFNELFIIVQAFLFLFLLIEGSYKKLSKLFITILILAFFISAAIVFISPGSRARMDGIEYKQWYVILAAIGFQAGEVMWCILKNPIAWIVFVIIFFYSHTRREKFIRFRFVHLFARKKWLLPVVVLSFLFLSVALGVVGLKGSILPDRYVNAVIVVMILWLLLLAFVIGITTKQVPVKPHFVLKKQLLVVAVIIVVPANEFVKDEYKSLLIAPFYNRVMDERETALQNNAGKAEVTINSYNSALQTILLTRYHNIPKTISDLLIQKPPFIFFTDDLENEESKETLCSFYKIKKITTR